MTWTAFAILAMFMIWHEVLGKMMYCVSSRRCVMRPKIYSSFPDKNETAGKMDPCETHLLLPLEVDDGDNRESNGEL